MSNWQSLFPTRAAAERYLATIIDPGRRAVARAHLDLEGGTRETSPPAPRVPAHEKPGSRRDSTPPAETRPPAPSPGPLTLLLPYPPSVNRIWRSMIIGCRCTPRAQIRVLLSARGRAYRRDAIQAHAAQGAPGLPAGARLALIIDVHAPDRRTRDLSNIPKALEDALTHAGLWEDDSLIDELHLYRRPPTPGGQIRITVTTLPHA